MKNGTSVALSTAMPSSRRGTIYLCSELVRVKYVLPSGGRGFATANLEEIAQQGTSLLMEESLPLGTEVIIYCKGNTLRGLVESRSYDELGYTTWVEFIQGTVWTPDWFRPSHLLDPQTLLTQRRAHVA